MPGGAVGGAVPRQDGLLRPRRVLGLHPGVVGQEPRVPHLPAHLSQVEEDQTQAAPAPQGIPAPPLPRACACWCVGVLVPQRWPACS